MSYEKFKLLHDTLKRIDQRRQYWDETLKERIIAKLSEYTKDPSINLTIQDAALIPDFLGKRSQGHVNIGYGPKPSGLTSTFINEDGVKTTQGLMVEGGTLHYHQSYTGKIQVYIWRPYILGVFEYFDDYKVEMLGSFDPEDINVDLISGHVNALLDALQSFFNEDDHRNSIGFQYGTTE